MGNRLPPTAVIDPLEGRANLHEATNPLLEAAPPVSSQPSSPRDDRRQHKEALTDGSRCEEVGASHVRASYHIGRRLAVVSSWGDTMRSSQPRSPH